LPFQHSDPLGAARAKNRAHVATARPLGYDGGPRLGMRLRHGSWAALVFAVAMPASAEPPDPAVVWYRSSEGCPDGPEFMARLGERASLARLAEAGDRVDFVVTLAATNEGSTGRLERQTESGTIAVSELRDDSCDRVAEALALSLALSLDPETHGQGQPDEPGEASQSPAPDVPAAAPTPHRNAAPHTTVPAPAWSQPAAAEPPPDTLRLRREPETQVWLVGVQGGAVSGLAPNALALAEAFVELGGALPQALPGLALRAGVVGILGSTTTAVGQVRHWVVAGRTEACPVQLGGARVTLLPCAALDLGATGASGTRSTGKLDTGLWAALGAHARLRWSVGGPVAVEAQLGLLVPLTQYELYGGSEVLYRTAAAGLSGSAGTSIRVP
jgi:hypothetical protein